MKHIWLVFGVFALNIPANAIAQSCSEAGYTTRINAPGQIRNELNNHQINAIAPDGEEWNEDHCQGGNLYKVGDGTPVDPRVLRGTWGTGGTGQNRTVTYDYGGSLPVYEWSLWSDGSGLCWESLTTSEIIATGTTQALSGSCP